MKNVSVIIPVKNGVATIERCLVSIFNQTIAQQLEVIVIDSGSTDKSLEIINRFDVKVIAIDPASFNHGDTRKLAIQYANGSFLYYTVQDACIASNDMLEKMLLHFEDEKVQGVCGSQGAPHEADKNPVDWYRPVSEACIQKLHFSSSEAFDQLSPQRKTEVCEWDDVNAMYRKSALLRLPFEKCDFGEDMTWCKAALRHGYTLIRDTSALTWHYHFRTYTYEFKVKLTVGYLQYVEFRFVPADESVMLRIKFICAKLIRESAVALHKKVYWFFHNLSILAADMKAVKLLKNAAADGGVAAVKKLYETEVSKPVIGRLKGQKHTG